LNEGSRVSVSAFERWINSLLEEISRFKKENTWIVGESEEMKKKYFEMSRVYNETEKVVAEWLKSYSDWLT